jgi:hypothetical protein
MRDIIGWRIIHEDADYDRMHVIPFNLNSNKIMTHHALLESCDCHPKIEQIEESTLIIHNMIH